MKWHRLVAKMLPFKLEYDSIVHIEASSRTFFDWKWHDCFCCFHVSNFCSFSIFRMLANALATQYVQLFATTIPSRTQRWWRRSINNFVHMTPINNEDIYIVTSPYSSWNLCAVCSYMSVIYLALKFHARTEMSIKKNDVSSLSYSLTQHDMPFA